MNNDVRYHVDAGDYPYRIDGLRMDAIEARRYLVERMRYGRAAADIAVNLARVDAANAAAEVRLARVEDCGKFTLRILHDQRR